MDQFNSFKVLDVGEEVLSHCYRVVREIKVMNYVEWGAGQEEILKPISKNQRGFCPKTYSCDSEYSTLFINILGETYLAKGNWIIPYLKEVGYAEGRYSARSWLKPRYKCFDQDLGHRFYMLPGEDPIKRETQQRLEVVSPIVDRKSTLGRCLKEVSLVDIGDEVLANCVLIPDNGIEIGSAYGDGRLGYYLQEPPTGNNYAIKTYSKSANKDRGSTMFITVSGETYITPGEWIIPILKEAGYTEGTYPSYYFSGDYYRYPSSTENIGEKHKLEMVFNPFKKTISNNQDK